MSVAIAQETRPAGTTAAPEHLLDPLTLGDHFDRLFRAAWALCGSREDAEDLVQDTYASVLARPRSVRNDDDLGYLLRALRNKFLERSPQRGAPSPGNEVRVRVVGTARLRHRLATAGGGGEPRGVRDDRGAAPRVARRTRCHRRGGPLLRRGRQCHADSRRRRLPAACSEPVAGSRRRFPGHRGNFSHLTWRVISTSCCRVVCEMTNVAARHVEEVENLERWPGLGSGICGHLHSPPIGTPHGTVNDCESRPSVGPVTVGAG